MREALTRSEAETETVAAELAGTFRGGEVVLLSGERRGQDRLARGPPAWGGRAGCADLRAPDLLSGRLTCITPTCHRLAGNGDDLSSASRSCRPAGCWRSNGRRLSPGTWIARAVRVTLEHAGDDARRIRIEGRRA